MKKIAFILLVILISPFSAAAQWIAKQSLNTNARRTFATAFSVNGKAYVVGGQVNFSGLADVWEYDPVQDSWMQKNPFPGGLRGGATAFSIGGKGYFMCGSNYVGQYFNDVWEYDPVQDSWTQKNNFPGMEREEAVGFAIGSLGYFGTGYQEVVGPNSTFFVTYSDFYEYDPANDAWTAKALLPSPPRGWAIGAAVGGRGYVGLGSNSGQNASYSDFYEYDPQTDTWTAKTGLGANAGDAMAFNLGSKIYVCGGFNFGTSVMYNTLRSFNPATNTWSLEASMAAGSTAGAVAVTISSRAFVGTGYSGGLTEKNDWWEFVSATATLCPAPVAFSTATFATSGTVPCDGRIVISNMSNGCAPYTCSLVPNAGTLSAGQGFTVSGLCAGTYSVYISDAGCCGTSVSVCTVPGNLTMGIAANAAAGEELSIWPNPNQGVFYLTLPVNIGNVQGQVFRLINSQGQAVPVNVAGTGREWMLSFPQSGRGMYLLQVLVNGAWIHKKVMVD